MRWAWRVLLLAVLAVSVVCVGIPTVAVFQTRSQVASAVRNASSIRLEEYTTRPERVLTSRELSSEEFPRVMEALPIAGDSGVPGLISRCFIPHHRIIIVDQAGQPTILLVCFGCEQIRVSGRGIQETPIGWQRPLREVFLQHGIPIRDRYAPAFGPEVDE